MKADIDTADSAFSAAFSAHAADYDRRNEHYLTHGAESVYSAIADELELSPGRKVVDLGCGTGTLTFLLGQRALPGGRVLGVDSVSAMVAVARARAASTMPEFEFLTADVEALAGIERAAFDAAGSAFVFHLCANPARAMLEAARIVRPGGRLAATVPRPQVQAPAAAPHDPLRALDRYLYAEVGPRRATAGGVRRSALMANGDWLRRAAYKAGFATADVRGLRYSVWWDDIGEFTSMLPVTCLFSSRLRGRPPSAQAEIVRRAAAHLEGEFPQGRVEAQLACTLLTARR